MAEIPNEIGQVLKEATTGEEGQGLVSSYSLHRVGISTGTWRGTAFNGQTTSGSDIVGVVVNKKGSFKYGSIEAGGGGVKIKNKKLETSDKEITATLKQKALYGRVKATLNTPDIKIGNLSIQGDIGAESQIFVANTKTKNKKGNNILDSRGAVTGAEHSINYIAGATGKWSSDDKKTKIQSRIQSNFRRDFNNVADKDHKSFHHNYTTVSTSFMRDVGSDVTFLAESTLALRNVGNSVIFKSGLIKENNRILAGYQTPLNNDAPRFIPGMQKVAIVGGEKSFLNDNLTFELTYRRNLDIDDNTVRTGVKFKW